MKKAILLGVLAALCAAPVYSRDANTGLGYANPGAVVAAEVAFSKLAQEKGQWTAFRTTAAKNAMMFTPLPVYAQDYLKTKPNPPQSVKWQPHQVWSSCDGSMAVTRGAWQHPGGKSGYFTTVWIRQKDGKYKWVLDQGDELPLPLDEPELIVAKVADCPQGYRPRRNAWIADPKGKLPPLDTGHLVGRSLDGTLSWDVTHTPEGARHFVVQVLIEGKLTTVQDIQVDAPAK